MTDWNLHKMERLEGIARWVPPDDRKVINAALVELKRLAEENVTVHVRAEYDADAFEQFKKRTQRRLEEYDRLCREAAEEIDGLRADTRKAMEVLQYIEPSLPVLATVLKKLDLKTHGIAEKMHAAVLEVLESGK